MMAAEKAQGEREQIEAWFRDQPAEISAAIAARAALRVLPLCGADLPSFRANFISWAARRYPTDNMRAVAGAAAFAINPYLSRSSVGDRPEYFANAAAAATEAAAAAAAAAAFATDVAVADAAAAGVAAAEHTGDDYAAAECRDAIRADTDWLVHNKQVGNKARARALIDQPLWLRDVLRNERFNANFPPWARKPFDDFHKSDLVQSGNWQPWVDWYRANLPNSRKARPKSAFGGTADIAIAMQPSEFWERDSDEVMADIGRILRGAPIHYRDAPSTEEMAPTEEQLEAASSDADAAALGAEPSQPTAAARAEAPPRVWVCQYRRSEAPTLESRLAPGLEEPWRMHPLTPETVAHEMHDGDPVVVWRTIDKAAPEGGKRSRGGIVATASIVKRDEDISEGRIRIRIREAFPDEPVPRDEVLEVTRGVSNWPGQVSMSRLGTDGYDDEPEQINALLLRYGHQPLFDEAARPIQPRARHEVEYVSDRPETARDLLGRAPLAFALAAQINRIWDAQTKEEPQVARWQRLCDALHITRAARPSPQPDEAAFILHIDAPWGGGKTTFANFIGRILNPTAFGLDASTGEAALLEGLPLDDPKLWKPQYRRRRWRVVHFNAWQHEHVSPPWWNFYEAIRRQCLRSMVHSRPEPPSADVPKWRRIGAEAKGHLQRCGRRLWYGLREVLWRLWSPATKRAVATTLLVLSLMFLVYLLGLPGWLERLEIADVKVTTLAALFASGGIGVLIFNAVRSGLSTFVESMSSSADAATLGEADPLHRFQNHFSWFVRQLREPVLVVVDDLDRCKPEYVVELVRGLLTIFRSPRVVFLLLGDKSWIEAAFAHVHTDMEKAHADAQISFGGRFAEKAIQLSFILPEATEEERNDYLLAVLTGRLPLAGTGGGTTESGASATDGTGAPAAAQAELSGRLAEFERNVRQRFAGTRDTEELVQAKAATRAEIEQLFTGTGDGRSDELASRFRQAAQRKIEVEASFRSSTSEQAEKEIRHGIEPVAPYLPGNPRRIKRIVNMVSAFQESGQIAQKIDPLSRHWRQLVLWTVIMSEYPRAWRTLVLDKAVAREALGLVGEADAGGVVKLPALRKGASDGEKARRAALADITSSPGLVRLLRGDPFNEAEASGEDHAIDADALNRLRRLTPLG